ncbi:hypothetical protein [Pseudoxanthomonas winnipegensis]|uniref:hypothetical protein n=1 Tax=Pseudoxanthomonas winnipegensis TaxID=2480810 RepID=UPI001039F45A|nr:hypothetical protein [Pseudoxanthomonas winnipegensis]TBV69792.1 hypothetical protein EYC45_19280 [Pseudoxanthomonas winnipegensis]
MKKGAIALALALAFSLATAAELPEGATEQFLSIQVNGKAITNFEVVHQQGDDFYATHAQLSAWGLVVPAFDGTASMRQLGIRPELNKALQALNLQVPSTLLPLQSFAPTSNIPSQLAPQPMGVMIDYDLAGRVDHTGDAALSLGHSLTTGLAGGALTTTGQLNTTSEGVEYIRGVTTWQKDNLDKGVVVQVGDVFTSRSTISTSVNLAGIRVASDPELTGGRFKAVPIIGGLADTRSTAEIYINEVKRQQEGLERGPFEFRRVHPRFHGHLREGRSRP